MTAGWSELWLVAAGGGLGGMARLALGDAVARRLGGGLPWGTLAVNLSGALLMGGLAGALGPAASGPAWSLMAIGLLGGYTTVSSFSLQTLTLVQQGRHGAAAANVLVTLVGGFAALLAGAWLAGGLA